MRAGGCCCPWALRGPPVCGPLEASWREATVDTRAWMLAMMARRSVVGASVRMLVSSMPSSSLSYPSESLYSSSLLSSLV